MSGFLPPRSGPTSESGEERVVDRLDFALRNLRPTAQESELQAPLGTAEPSGPGLEPRTVEPSRDKRRAALAVTLGDAHLSAGTLASAEREYRDALAADPGNGDAHGSLARTLARLGRLDEAEQQLRAAEAAGTPVSPAVVQEIRERLAARNS
jgi:predicted Zn-dependent protease